MAEQGGFNETGKAGHHERNKIAGEGPINASGAPTTSAADRPQRPHRSIAPRGRGSAAAEHFQGTARRLLASPPDAWGGRAAADWTRRLAAGGRFDPAVEGLIPVAGTLDRVYGR